MAANLTDWGTEVNAHIPGVPEPTLQVAVRNAARIFCEKTHIWTQDLDRINVEGDTQDYPLSDPSNARVITVPKGGVKYKQDGEDDDQFITLEAASELQNDYFNFGNWKFVDAPTPRKYFVDNVNKQISLIPIPTDDSDEGLLVKVTLKPDDTCTTVPDFIYDDWKDVIRDGALGYLFGIKRASWYDPQEMTYRLGFFLRQCNNAKGRKISGATDRPMRVKMRRIW